MIKENYSREEFVKKFNDTKKFFDYVMQRSDDNLVRVSFSSQQEMEHQKVSKIRLVSFFVKNRIIYSVTINNDNDGVKFYFHDSRKKDSSKLNENEEIIISESSFKIQITSFLYSGDASMKHNHLHYSEGE